QPDAEAAIRVESQYALPAQWRLKIHVGCRALQVQHQAASAISLNLLEATDDAARMFYARWRLGSHSFEKAIRRQFSGPHWVCRGHHDVLDLYARLRCRAFNLHPHHLPHFGSHRTPQLWYEKYTRVAGHTLKQIDIHHRQIPLRGQVPSHQSFGEAQRARIHGVPGNHQKETTIGKTFFDIGRIWREVTTRQRRQLIQRHTLHGKGVVQYLGYHGTPLFRIIGELGLDNSNPPPRREQQHINRASIHEDLCPPRQPDLIRGYPASLAARTDHQIRVAVDRIAEPRLRQSHIPSEHAAISRPWGTATIKLRRKEQLIPDALHLSPLENDSCCRPCEPYFR